MGANPIGGGRCAALNSAILTRNILESARRAYRAVREVRGGTTLSDEVNIHLRLLLL